MTRYSHYRSVGTPGLELARTTCFLLTFLSFMLSILFTIYINDTVWGGKFFYLMLFMLMLGILLSAVISVKRGSGG
jgi:hypothetical protein